MANFNSYRTCGSSLAAADNSYGCAETADCGCTASESVLALESAGDDVCTCCKASMRAALRLFCCNAISDLVDFDSFAFISDTNYVGTTPVTIGTETSDNLGGFEGSFRRFSPCSCDLLDITGTVYTPSGLTVAVTQANLCTLTAIAFELLPAPEETSGGCCCEETDLSRFRRVRNLLQRALPSMPQPCGECAVQCDCTDDCCCTDGVISALSGAAMNNRATLSAGLLSLQNVNVLGSIGSVLVLANETQGRFYFVCANKVDFFD